MTQPCGGAAPIKLFGLLGSRDSQRKLKFGLHVEVKSCDLDEHLIFR